MSQISIHRTIVWSESNHIRNGLDPDEHTFMLTYTKGVQIMCRKAPVHLILVLAESSQIMD